MQVQKTHFGNLRGAEQLMHGDYVQLHTPGLGHAPGAEWGFRMYDVSGGPSHYQGWFLGTTTHRVDIGRVNFFTAQGVPDPLDPDGGGWITGQSFSSGGGVFYERGQSSFRTIATATMARWIGTSCRESRPSSLDRGREATTST